MREADMKPCTLSGARVPFLCKVSLVKRLSNIPESLCNKVKAKMSFGRRKNKRGESGSFDKEVLSVAN